LNLHKSWKDRKHFDKDNTAEEAKNH